MAGTHTHLLLVVVLAVSVVKGYRPAVFVNRFSSAGCNLTHENDVQIARAFTGCYPAPAYNGSGMLRWTGGTHLDDRIQYYGQDCNTNCVHCKSSIHDTGFGSCSNALGYGTMFYPTTWRPCVTKAPQVSPNDVVVSHFKDTQCNLQSNLTNVASIMLLVDNKCKHRPNGWWQIKTTVAGDKNVTYNGVMGCTGSTCTPTGCLGTITNWQQGSCHTVEGYAGSFSIQRYESLHDCDVPEPAPQSNHAELSPVAWVAISLASLGITWCAVLAVPVVKRRLGHARANIFGYSSIEG